MARTLDHRFVAQTVADIQTVKTRLADAKAAIPPLQDQLSKAAFAAALSGDYSEAERIEGELGTARNRVNLLLQALDTAETVERERLAAKRQKEEAARLRALRQHLSRVEKHAAEIEDLLTRYDATWRALCAAADAALPLARDDQHLYSYLQMPLREAAVRREMGRVGDRFALYAEPANPLARGALATIEQQRRHEIEPLSAAVKNTLDAGYNRIAGNPTQPPPAAPAPEPPPPAPPAPSTPTSIPPVQDAPITPMHLTGSFERIDLGRAAKATPTPAAADALGSTDPEAVQDFAAAPEPASVAAALLGTE